MANFLDLFLQNGRLVWGRELAEKDPHRLYKSSWTEPVASTASKFTPYNQIKTAKNDATGVTQSTKDHSTQKRIKRND